VTVQVERGLDSICFLLRRPVLNNNPYVVVVVQSNHRQKRRRKMCPCVCYDGSIRVEGKTFFRGYSRYFCVCCVIFSSVQTGSLSLDHDDTSHTREILLRTRDRRFSFFLSATRHDGNDTERESLSRIPAGRRRPSAICFIRRRFVF
jgi:hypothetical protein